MAPSVTLLAVFITTTLLATGSEAGSCSSQNLATKFQNCVDLPTLGAYLHYSYNYANKSIFTAFVAKPARPTGWVGWGINPKGRMMAGSQTFVAYKKKGNLVAKTYNLVAPAADKVIQGPLSFETWDLKADYYGKTGYYVIYSKAKVPAASQVNMSYVWQVGPGVRSGQLSPHAFAPANLQATGVLHLG